jgi:hypothetical protein
MKRFPSSGGRPTHGLRRLEPQPDGFSHCPQPSAPNEAPAGDLFWGEGEGEGASSSVAAANLGPPHRRRQALDQVLPVLEADRPQHPRTADPLSAAAKSSTRSCVFSRPIDRRTREPPIRSAPLRSLRSRPACSGGRSTAASANRRSAQRGCEVFDQVLRVLEADRPQQLIGITHRAPPAATDPHHPPDTARSN